MDAILNAILKTQRSCHAISFRSAWQLRFCIKKYSILLCTCFLIHVIFLYKKEKFSYTVLLSECISSIEQ